MFNINDTIKLKDNNIKGIIIRKNIEKNNYLIRLENNMLSNLNSDQFEKYIKNDRYIKNNFVKEKINFELNASKDFKPEIMLRHKTLEEAINELDSFIYKSISNNQKRIRIIHGKNGGILRKGVHEYLRNNEYIKEFHLGDYYEGSYGVTVATLK